MPRSNVAASDRVRVRPWHTLPARDVLHALGTPENGIDRAEAARRLQEDGPNLLQGKEGPSPAAIFLRQFRSPLIAILLVAAVIAFSVGKRFDVWIILGIVMVNALIGGGQELRAAGAIAALQKLTSPQAKVLREGEIHEVATSELVLGDVLVLSAGDRVGADARILSASELTVDESALTGESLPVVKSSDSLPGKEEAPLGDRVNMSYMNTVVTQGRGRAVVVATGMATEMGKIAQEVSETESTTPIQRRLAAFSRRLGGVIMGIVATVTAFGLLIGRPFSEMFSVALSLSVAAIPEGLPIVVSILLALGVRRMARRRALIRRLPAVEALGSTTVICSDKTGTLTRNEMTVRQIFTGDVLFEAEGEGYRPEGRILLDGHPLEQREGLRWLGACARLCNDSMLVEEAGDWQILGDPTEGALIVLSEKLNAHMEWDRVEEIPFSSERKWMATLNRIPEQEGVAFAKGAFDRLLPMARSWLDSEGRAHALDDPSRARWVAASEAMAGNALRVLALGMVRPLELTQGFCPDLMEGNLTLLGLVGMLDPPRPEAVEAIRICQEAGIRIVMITGDHRATAVAIASRMGILQGDPEQRAVEGGSLEPLSQEGLHELVTRTDVYARVNPFHKLAIVTALQQHGEIVAMTGDGVNDAPALAQADIGVAMGVSGTEVAKGASDMVLADDNFATIEAAVEEGRIIADNLRKVVRYLLTTSIGSIGTIAGALLLGMPLPLLALQILWINLVTDGVFDKALALERGEPDLMSRPPRDPKSPLLPGHVLRRMFLLGGWMVAGTLATYAWQLGEGESLDHARSMAFTTLVAFQWSSAFSFRSYDKSVLQLPPNPWMFGALGLAVLLQLLAIYHPFLQVVLSTVPLEPMEFVGALVIGSSLLLVSEARKAFLRRSR